MSLKKLCGILSIMAIVVIFLNDVVESGSRKDKIKLKDVQVLTLRPNQMTTGRRSRPVPQLHCVGGYCDAIKGQTVQCVNRGSDGIDIQWECSANIKSGYQFGELSVICEGYDFPDDEYVLVGSCGLEYRIESTGSHNSFFGANQPQSTKSRPSEGFSFVFILCIAGIIFIIYYTCLRPNGASPGRSSSRGRSPPPPGFRSDFFDNNDGCSSSRSFSGFTDERTQTNANTGNTGNGFLSGLLTGGTLGYLFGSRNTTNYRDQSSYFGSRANPSNYFSNTDTSSKPSTSTTKGFGGTKRR